MRSQCFQKIYKYVQKGLKLSYYTGRPLVNHNTRKATYFFQTFKKRNVHTIVFSIILLISRLLGFFKIQRKHSHCFLISEKTWYWKISYFSHTFSLHKNFPYFFYIGGGHPAIIHPMMNCKNNIYAGFKCVPRKYHKWR